MRALLLAAFAILPCQAAEWHEHWTPVSTTASAITGDVTLRADRLVFANGQSLPIAKRTNLTFAPDVGTPVPATLYAVPAPADPPLLNGNRLCGSARGSRPVTFVVIWHTKPLVAGEKPGRAFAPYAGRLPPMPTAKTACGTYYYDVQR